MAEVSGSKLVDSNLKRIFLRLLFCICLNHVQNHHDHLLYNVINLFSPKHTQYQHVTLRLHNLLRSQILDQFKICTFWHFVYMEPAKNIQIVDWLAIHYKTLSCKIEVKFLSSVNKKMIGTV